MGYRQKEFFLFVVLLEKLFLETTFLGCQVENLLVVELAVELSREPFCNVPASRANLTSDSYDDSIHLSWVLFYAQ